MADAKGQKPAFLAGGGEMGARIRAYDWASTPLGSVEDWPQALCTLVQVILSAAHPMFLIWGHKRTVIYNDATLPMWGRIHPSALGASYLNDVLPELREYLGPIVEKAFSGETVHLENLPFTFNRNGYMEESTYSFSYTPVKTSNGVVDGLLCPITETTGQVFAERKLRELNETLEHQVAARTAELDRAWQVSQELLVVASSEGIIEVVNPMWTGVLGWERSELIGQPFINLAHPDELERTLVIFAAIFEQPLVTPYEYRFRHKDGSYRWFGWTAAFENGKVYASGRHITVEREQAEALRQSQKMEAVGQLTGGVAHDFNNLLTVIKSSTDLLKRPNLPEERRARYVSAISDTVDRAAKLTGQLLAFARRQALKPEVFAASASVRALSDMMRTLTGSRIQITTDLSEHTSYVEVDPSQFDTALVNLAVNARDAMDGEGRITVAVRVVDTIPALRAHPIRDGDYVAVSMSDTGSGMPADMIERIFEPFFTTKGVGKGTGLGLSQVFGFVKQSGGDIMVDSTVGEGTTFTLYLPRVIAPEEDGTAEDMKVPADGHGTCVLIVEDNSDVGTFTVQSLMDLGYTTVLATDATAALDELAQNAGRFDVVFSDVVMPGMSGIELGQEIRRLYHDLPVVLTSGYSHVLAQNGTYGFELLHKPYSVEQLSQMLRKATTWQRRKRLLGN